MSSRYTAKEMRLAADNVCSDFTFARVNVGSNARPVYREIKPYEVANMLRQAADAMEREGRKKRYEYSRAFYDGTVSAVRVDDIKVAKLMSKFGPYIFRREVGEWEGVPNV